jgi:uncharacterized protein YdaT
MARRTYHVVSSDKGWSVKRENSQRASSTHNIKQDAIQRGKELANSSSEGQLIIHRKDGKIQTEYTYGNDPERYPG